MELVRIDSAGPDLNGMMAQALKEIEALKAQEPGVRFWIGCFKLGGHGDFLTLCAFARAAKRFWAGRGIGKAGVIAIGRATGSQEDGDIGQRQPEIDGMLRLPEYHWRLQAMQFARSRAFDAFYEVGYAVKATFPDLARFAVAQAEADAHLAPFADVYHRFPFSSNDLGRRWPLSQWELMSLSSGIQVTPDDLAICLDVPEPAGRDLHGPEWFEAFKGCITIHNGEGGNGSTKSLPRATAQAMVDGLVAQGYRVCQVGIRNDDKEPVLTGATDLRGLPINHTARVIRGAVLHIDVEGGLVYIARAVGTPCLVFFGPTPIVVFGFEGNRNVCRDACRPCWWSTADWFTRCPKGHLHCINLPEPDTAARIALEAASTARARGNPASQAPEPGPAPAASSGTPPLAAEPPGDGLVRLNVGCGTCPISGWVNMDSQAEIGDFCHAHGFEFRQALAHELPVAAGAAAELYAAHVLEHYPWMAAPGQPSARDVLREWARVLRPGGTLWVAVPDLGAICEQVARNVTTRAGWIADLYGKPEVGQHMGHCWGYTRESLEAALAEAGFAAIEPFTAWVQDPVRGCGDAAGGWRADDAGNHIPCSLNLKAVRKV